MKFRVKVSPLMENWRSPLGSIENRLLRIPFKLREKLGFEPGFFLSLSGKGNEAIPLTVSHCYKIDAEQDDECAYVSQDTHDLLKLQVISSIKPLEDILIGCDPEFFLVDRSTTFSVSASHFFPHWGEIGNDCGLAELRPRPYLNEKAVISELYRLLKRCYDRIQKRSLYRKKDIHMIAASHWNNASAGFHIHFGLPTFMLNSVPRNSHLLHNMAMILDYYIGIPSILPEGDEDYFRRSERFSRYGKPGDWRWDTTTLEYRVPGGHLMRHPVLASGLLAMSAVVMKDIRSRLHAYTNGFKKEIKFKDYDQLKDLYPNLPDRKKVYETIVSEKIDKAVSFSGTILNDLSKMIGYEDNRESITRYFEYVLAYIEGKIKFDEDMEINWRLSNHEGQPRKMAVFS